MLLGLLIALGWLVTLVLAHTVNVWLATGAMGAAALLLSLLWCRRLWLPLLAPHAPMVLLGVCAGLIMAGATHLLYAVGKSIVPGLPAEVTRLYRQLRTPPGPVRALPLLALIVLSEEVAFRGLLLGALRRYGATAAVLGSALLYAVPQIGTGSPLLVALALSCGVLWGIERLLTGGLLAPLLTHLVWDALVFVALPLR